MALSLQLHANDRNAKQPAHTHRPISDFVIRYLEIKGDGNPDDYYVLYESSE